MVVISLIVIAVIFPLGIGLVSAMGDYVWLAENATAPNIPPADILLTDIVDPAVITLVTVLLPILAVIGVVLYFLPNRSD